MTMQNDSQNNVPIITKEIQFNSQDYIHEVYIRNEVLRIPLGLILSPEQLLDEEDEFHIGAFISEKLIGCLLLKQLTPSEIQMRQMAILTKHQKKGAGRELILFSEKFAMDKGFKSIILHARNTAKPFYERMGYHTCSSEYLEVGIPHFTMMKIL